MPATTETELPACTRSSSLDGTIRHFSQRLIAAQRTVRLLDALPWGEQVERTFLTHGCRELPKVNRDDYLSRPLPFDPDRKQMEFQDLERDVTRALGSAHGVGRILVRMCREYAGVVRLLAYRGTRTFATISARLFGSTRDGSTCAALELLDELNRRFPAQAQYGP